MRSFFAMIAPGTFSAAYSDISMTGKAVSGGMGRKEPYKAASMSPDSVQIGSWTVTRKTLVWLAAEIEFIGTFPDELTHQEMSLPLEFRVIDLEHLEEHVGGLEPSCHMT